YLGVEISIVSSQMLARIKVALILFVSLATSSLAVHPTEQIWTGEIGDSHCRFEHEPLAEGHPVLPSPECVKLCLKSGFKYVLIADDKLYAIANPENPDLAKFAGQTVKVTGELKGDAITVSRIESSVRFNSSGVKIPLQGPAGQSKYST